MKQLIKNREANNKNELRGITKAIAV